MRRSRWEESSFGRFARINCLRPAPVAFCGSETSRGRSGMDAEKRTVMRASAGSVVLSGVRKAGDAIIEVFF